MGMLSVIKVSSLINKRRSRHAIIPSRIYVVELGQLVVLIWIDSIHLRCRESKFSDRPEGEMSSSIRVSRKRANESSKGTGLKSRNRSVREVRVSSSAIHVPTIQGIMQPITPERTALRGNASGASKSPLYIVTLRNSRVTQICEMSLVGVATLNRSSHGIDKMVP